MPQPNAERLIQWYGYAPDLPDIRDNNYLFIPEPPPLPSALDLRPGFPFPPFDQGELGSCTANAWAAIVSYDQNRQDLSPIMESRLFQYYNTRRIEGTPGEDSGATIRDTIKAYVKYGSLPEFKMPYDISKFTVKPTQAMYRSAKPYGPLIYRRVNQTSDDMKAALAQIGPIDIGFSVYDEFESDEVASTGVVPMPSNDSSLLGGHSVCLCGYVDSGGDAVFIARNSWGTDWGQEGYFTIPFDYILNPDLAEDFWIIDTVKG